MTPQSVTDSKYISDVIVPLQHLSHSQSVPRRAAFHGTSSITGPVDILLSSRSINPSVATPRPRGIAPDLY